MPEIICEQQPVHTFGPKATCLATHNAGHLLTKQLALRPFGSAFELRVRQGRAPGPWPPAATLGDVQLSQTLTGLSAREREVSPSPFIPTRRWALAEPPCTLWQPIQLGPKRGPSPLWTLHGKDHSPSVPAPFPASPTVNPRLPWHTLPAPSVEKQRVAVAESRVVNEARAPLLSGFAHLLRCRKDLG